MDIVSTAIRRFPTLGEAFRIGPHARAHTVAARVLTSALVPAAVLLGLGRTDLLPFALLTSLMSVYGRRASRAQRLAVQGQVMALQVALLLIGAALAVVAPGPVTVVIGTAIVAGLTTVIADVRGWNPPGALFFTFGFAVIVSAPAVISLMDVALTAVAAAIFALIVTALFSRTVPAIAAPPHVPKPGLVVGVHALICLVGAAAAGSIGVALGISHPYWAMVAAIVPVVGLTTSGQTLKAFQRVAGTLVGLLIAFALFAWNLPSPAVLLVIVSLMALTELFIARNYALALLFLTPITIGLPFLAGTPDLGELLAARGLETVIGSAVGFVLILASHRVRHPRARD